MTRIKYLLLASIIYSLLATGSVNAQILYDAVQIKTVKESLAAGKKEYKPAYDKLKRDAEKALEVKPLSVVNKKQTPPSGDKHDYMSMGKYWWPDPSKPDGRPYIRKDGEVYPGTADLPNHDDFSKLVSAVETLSLAYYFSNDERYAEHCAKLIKVWFLDKGTKMNPNMNYAQAIEGLNEGRGSGIIDVHGMPRIIDASILLQGSKHWSNENQNELKKWFGEFLTWLQESKNGKDEAKAKNNHGTWYDVLVSSIALFTGDNETAKNICSQSMSKRIKLQIEPDGSQPLELVRTTSMHYSMFNLDALFNLAKLAGSVNIDIWNYRTDDGRSIKKAIDFMAPFLLKQKKWEHKQIKEFDIKKYYSFFVKAYLVYKDKSYLPLIDACKISDYKKQRSYLLYQPSDIE